MVSFRKLLVVLSLGAVVASSATGCFLSDSEGSTPPGYVLQNGPATPDKTLLDRTCGKEGDPVMASYTGGLAHRCGDEVTVSGITVKGTRVYNETDDRWSLFFTIPAGATSGDVVAQCGSSKITIAPIAIPCPPEGSTLNAFQRLEGELKIGRGCDDPDGKVTLGDFTADSFVMTGLADNGPITFKVKDNVATADGVVQYGKGGHTVRVVLDGTLVRFEAESPEGSCQTTLSK